MNRQNRVPLSLEDLKRKRDEEASKASRPVFQTKAQRQAAALARLAEKRAAQLAQNSTTQVNVATKRPRSPREEERQQIRNHYMRTPQYVTTARKRERRFRFEWDPADDTSTNGEFHLQPMSKAVPPQLGRGRLGEVSGMTSKLLRDQRHWSEKARSEMTERDWRIFREDYLLTIRGPAPHPARNWDETDLPHDLLVLVRDVARYKTPSPIQMAAIPVALSGQDLIGLAETGSGKTAAFVLPLLVHVRKQPRMTPSVASHGPYVLILAPTRELALQIEAEAQRFGEPSGCRVLSVIGGQELDMQATLLQAGCEVVVCTPGRMVDLLSKQMAVLGNCKYLILDEADRMIDMGFEPQLAEVLDYMPSGKRQTFMFSATMSRPVERMARSYLTDPLIISVGEKGKAADNIDQRVEYFSSEARRRDRFVNMLETLEAPILVFVNTRSGCEMVARYVEANSWVRPVVMHSGKSQDQREKTLQGFKTGRFKVLVATDVVGRGIDIKGVRHVINFELPKSIEAYTHRIGRTGRAGEKGTAWSLAVESDGELFGPLAKLLKQSGARVPQEIAREANGRGGKGFRPITD